MSRCYKALKRSTQKRSHKTVKLIRMNVKLSDVVAKEMRIDKIRISFSICQRLCLYKFKNIFIDSLRFRCRHSVGESRIANELAVFQQLGGFQP